MHNINSDTISFSNRHLRRYMQNSIHLPFELSEVSADQSRPDQVWIDGCIQVERLLHVTQHQNNELLAIGQLHFGPQDFHAA